MKTLPMAAFFVPSAARRTEGSPQEKRAAMEGREVEKRARGSINIRGGHRDVDQGIPT